MDSDARRAIVIGAGISGLATAVGLHRSGSRLELVEEAADRVTAHLVTADGQVSDEAAVLIAADGIRSTVRGQLWPADFAPAYAGFTAWRGVTDQAYQLAEQSQTLGPWVKAAASPWRTRSCSAMR